SGSVDETLSLSGSLASATRRDRAFGASGTVDSVNVRVGDTVEAGAVLATIDDADLQDAVDSAESRLADAEQALADDLASQTSTSSNSSSSASSSGGGSSTPAGGGSDGSDTAALSAAVDKVVAAQQSLLTLAQTAADALADAQDSQTSAATLCQPFLDATLADPGDTGDTEAAEGAEAADDEEDTATPLTLDAVKQLLADCQAAIAGVGDAQTVVASAQAAVQAGMTDLDDAIGELRAAIAASSTSGGSAGGSSAGSATSAGSGSASGSSSSAGGSGATASAADIVADRAAIDLAQADLDVARHDLTAASLTTPIAGTVAYVGFAVGDDVSAGSTTQVATIIGDDGYTVTSTVTLAQISKVRAGQTGTAVITSSGASYAATVSSVGLVNV
ncbi:biotin/lipoyl-binding protein, partial [Schumannella luteola]